MNVLIVDDEINIRQLMSRYLKLEEFAARRKTASAPNECSVSRALTCVIDLKMPGMNGLELIQWIRSEGCACRSS